MTWDKEGKVLISSQLKKMLDLIALILFLPLPGEAHPPSLLASRANTHSEAGPLLQFMRHEPEKRGTGPDIYEILSTLRESIWVA